MPQMHKTLRKVKSRYVCCFGEFVIFLGSCLWFCVWLGFGFIIANTISIVCKSNKDISCNKMIASWILVCWVTLHVILFLLLTGFQLNSDLGIPFCDYFACFFSQLSWLLEELGVKPTLSKRVLSQNNNISSQFWSSSQILSDWNASNIWLCLFYFLIRHNSVFYVLPFFVKEHCSLSTDLGVQ